MKLNTPDGWQFNIIAVDDGSTDSTATLISKINSPKLKFLQLPSNQGRAAARSSAARTSLADFLLFLDADCQPDDDNYFFAAIREIERGANVIFGPIGNTGTGFWNQYLSEVEKKWTQNAVKGNWLHAITSANLLVSRQIYNAAGGFNPLYTHYGFEDKDLIARLLTQTNIHIAHAPFMRVHHDAGNTVEKYCAKMRDAARYSAPLFFRDHLHYYQAMSYGQIDYAVNNSWWLAIVGRLSTSLCKPFKKLAALLVQTQLLSYPATKKIVQTAAALYYIQGTRQRGKGDQSSG